MKRQTAKTPSAISARAPMRSSQGARLNRSHHRMTTRAPANQPISPTLLSLRTGTSHLKSHISTSATAAGHTRSGFPGTEACIDVVMLRPDARQRSFVPFPSYQDPHVAERQLRGDRLEIGKFNQFRESIVANEAALLQHALRGMMVRMAESREALEPERRCQLDHRGKRFGGIAQSPCIPGEHVAGHRLLRGLK